MLTGRDLEIIEAVKLHGMMRSDQIMRIFFADHKYPNQKLSKRMQAIIESGEIKERFGVFTHQKIYYTKDAQERHKLLLSEFYVRLRLGPGKIIEYEPEFAWSNLRADAFCAYLVDDIVKPLLIECQLNGYPDLEKYEKLYSNGYPWPEFPRVVIISPKRLTFKKSEIDFRWIKETFDGWEDILKAPV